MQFSPCFKIHNRFLDIHTSMVVPRFETKREKAHSGIWRRCIEISCSNIIYFFAIGRLGFTNNILTRKRGVVCPNWAHHHNITTYRLYSKFTASIENVIVYVTYNYTIFSTGSQFWNIVTVATVQMKGSVLFCVGCKTKNMIDCHSIKIVATTIETQ